MFSCSSALLLRLHTQAELLERELVSVVAMADKLRIVRGWIKGYAAHSTELVTTTFELNNSLPSSSTNVLFVAHLWTVAVVVVVAGVGVTEN